MTVLTRARIEHSIHRLLLIIRCACMWPGQVVYNYHYPLFILKICISNDILNVLHGCNIYYSAWFSIGNSTTNLVPCPCNSSENCFSFEDDNGTEICSCISGYELQMTNQNGQVCTGIIIILYNILQWNPSKVDTIGTKNFVRCNEVSLVQE